jgi:hypothetical protein
MKLGRGRTLQQQFEIEFHIAARCQTASGEVRRFIFRSSIHSFFHRGRFNVGYFQ